MVRTLVTASGRLRQKFFERGDDQAVGLFRADGHPQRIRQLVGAELAQDQPARSEKSVGFAGRSPFRRRKMDQQKVGDARGHFQAELFSSCASQPASLAL